MLRTARTTTAAVLAALVLAAGCSQVERTAEVDVDGPQGPATEEQDATAGGAAPAQVRGATLSRGARSQVDPAAGDPALADAANQLISRLANDPTLLQGVLNGSVTDLERITGLDSATLQRLRITPESIRALASVLSRLDPSTISQLASGSTTPEGINRTILLLAAQLNPEAFQAIQGIDPRLLSVLASTAANVDPDVAEALGRVLGVVDPDGLGTVKGDRTSLGLLAVLFAAALRIDPTTFEQLGNASQVDPDFALAIDGIRTLASGLSLEFVANINEVVRVLGTDLASALGAILGFLGDERYADVLRTGLSDPVVVQAVIAVSALLIPGLAEVVAPEVFADDPSARSLALAALLLVALVGSTGVDLTGGGILGPG